MRNALIALVILTTVNLAIGEEPVYFADANLKTALEQALGVMIRDSLKPEAKNVSS